MGLVNLPAPPPTYRKRTDLVDGMTGQNPAFLLPTTNNNNPNPNLTPPTFTLPKDYNFNDLANYESTARGRFGNTASADILGTRDKLATSLNDYGKNFFEQQNPALLEDLNSRGFLTSQSEVANAETRALKDIGLENSKYLRDFDTAALNARLQAQQDALDAGMDLRRGGLEQANADRQSNAEMSMARDLADKQSRNQLTGSLIGAGSTLFGAALPTILKHTFAKDAANTALAGVPGTTAATGMGANGIPLASAGGAAPMFGAGGTLLNTAGTSSIGLGSILPAAGGYYVGSKVAPATQAGDKGAENVGAAVGAGVGSLFGPVGTAAGAVLGTVAGKGSNRLAAGVDSKWGHTAGTIARYSNPLTGIPAVVSKIKKAFGPGSTGTNVGDQQRAMNDLYSQSNDLKGMLDRGDIDQASYEEAQDAMNQNAILLYHQTAAQGGKAADNIRKNFNQLLNSGLIQKVGNDSYASTVGKKLNSQQIVDLVAKQKTDAAKKVVA